MSEGKTEIFQLFLTNELVQNRFAVLKPLGFVLAEDLA